jgi:hypothetical protein
MTEGAARPRRPHEIVVAAKPHLFMEVVAGAEALG